jgi:hypothetical protein
MGRRCWALFAVLIAVRVVAVPIALAERATDGRRTVLQGDVRRYHKIASARGAPYRDFMVEYPPVMFAAIELLDGTTVRETTVRVMWSQLLLDLGIALLVLWGWGSKASLAYLVLGLPFLLYPFLYLRLDLLSVALAVGGLALVRRRRPAWGGSALAVACFAKVWPVLLAPSLPVRRSVRGITAFIAAGIVGVGVWLLWAGTDSPVQVLTLRGARGWEIESTVGALLHTLGTQAVHGEAGAWRIGVVPGWARVAMPCGLLLATAAVWWTASRVRPLTRGVLDGLAPLAAIGAFLVLSPIVSPQYLCWLLPFGAVAWAHGERLAGWLTLGLVALSTADLLLIKELVDGQLFPEAIVLARNLLLLGFVGYSGARLAALAIRRETSPASASLAPEEAAA